MAIPNWPEGTMFVDLPGEPKLEERLQDLDQHVQDRGGGDLIISFSQVTILNTSCLAILMRLRQQLQGCGHRLVLCNIGTVTQGILSVTGLDRVFEIAGDTREALAVLYNRAQDTAVPQTRGVGPQRYSPALEPLTEGQGSSPGAAATLQRGDQET